MVVVVVVVATDTSTRLMSFQDRSYDLENGSEWKKDGDKPEYRERTVQETTTFAGAGSVEA